MTAQDVTAMVSNLGFPIVACLAMIVALCYIVRQHKAEMDSHKQAMDKMSDALNNNTLVMQKLVDKLNEG